MNPNTVIRCVWEHNGEDTLLYAENFPGAYARGKTIEEALGKIKREVADYLTWAGKAVIDIQQIAIVQEKKSNLQICDADSDVLFEAERKPLSTEEYQLWKALTLKSAADFLALYRAVPDQNQSCLPCRETFYGKIPRTAAEMYEHTKNVNSYYFSEIGVCVTNGGTIQTCRQRGFALLEQKPGYLEMPAVCGSYDELWSLRKVLRRFLWHDRIHAKAMYRMAVNTFGAQSLPNIFRFGG